jgi:hypothetical protein
LSIEGLDEMLTVYRLGLPAQLKSSLACTNSIDNMMGTMRRVGRNVKRWRNAAMALSLDRCQQPLGTQICTACSSAQAQHYKRA